ncbi:MAG: aminotransferase class IV [Campylobacterales bacterium]
MSLSPKSTSPLLETLLVRDGEVQHLSWHRKRMERSCQLLFNAPPPILDLQPPQGFSGRCRVIYDTTIHSIDYFPLTPRTFQRFALIEAAPTYNHKYANRSELDALKASYPDADEVIIVTSGVLTDTTISNIALFDGRHWLTPDTPLLEGTTRARLLDVGFLHPARLTPANLYEASGFAMINALLGFYPITNPHFITTKERT